MILKEELFLKEKQYIVYGRHGLKISFNNPNPEECLADKSLAGLFGKELKFALKKPFVVIENIEIKIEYDNDIFTFTIPKGYDWNGANVPAFAWVIIGQQKEPRFKLASCVHDFLCENKEVIDYNRYLSTLIFETLCEYFGRFNPFKRWAMFHSVDNYQKFCGWNKGK